MSSDPIEQPLADLARALRERSLTAAGLLDRAIARHDGAGAALHAYRTWAPEHARRAALAADAAFAAGSDLGPLQGIPVSVKDLYGVAGLPTFAGTPHRLPERWERDGPVVTELRRQLGVITGKTHTVEFAFGGLGVNNHWGTPRNPWDAVTHRVPGGSSAGAGVSLCEGSALLALGTDTAGSVRIPAAMTGNVGLKTSVGRWPVGGIVPLSSTLDTAGLLARTAGDVAWGFAALDPAFTGGTAERARNETLDAADLRIGVGDACLWEDCSPGVAEAVHESLDELAKAGARIGQAPLPEAGAAIELLQIGSVAAAECDAFLAAELPDWRESLDPIISSRIADGGTIQAREYLARLRRLHELYAAAAGRFEGVQVIASPTVSSTPPALEDTERLEDYRPRNFASLRNTCVANYLGLCALTLPVGLDRASMPVGLQLLAPHGDEPRLLAVARAVERVLGTGRQRIGLAPLCPP